MRITKKMIAAADEEGACIVALEWLRAKPRTLKQLVDYTLYGYHIGFYWLEWVLQYANGVLTGKARIEARKLYRAKEKELGY